MEKVYHEFLAGVRGGLVVEQSHQGQLFRILRMFVELPGTMECLARSGSNPIQPVEVARRLGEVAMRLQRRLADKLQPTE